MTETRELCFLPTIPGYWIFFTQRVALGVFSVSSYVSLPPMIHPVMAIGNGKEREFEGIESQLKRKDQL